MPFACGLTLEQLSAHTVDEAGKPAFVKDNPLEMLRKVRTATFLICLVAHLHSAASRASAVHVRSATFLISLVAHLHSAAIYALALHMSIPQPTWESSISHPLGSLSCLPQ